VLEAHGVEAAWGLNHDVDAGVLTLTPPPTQETT